MRSPQTSLPRVLLPRRWAHFPAALALLLSATGCIPKDTYCHGPDLSRVTCQRLTNDPFVERVPEFRFASTPSSPSGSPYSGGTSYGARDPGEEPSTTPYPPPGEDDAGPGPGRFDWVGPPRYPSTWGAGP